MHSETLELQMYSTPAIFEYICNSDKGNANHKVRKQPGFEDFREEKQGTLVRIKMNKSNRPLQSLGDQ